MTQSEGRGSQQKSINESQGDLFCGQTPGKIKDLGKAISQPVVLISAPGALSKPVLEIGTGIAIIAASLYLVHNEQFWAVAVLIVGFILLFLGINRTKLHDRKKRIVQLYQRGFTYQVGKEFTELAFIDVERASLSSDELKIKGMPIGFMHLLSLSCGNRQFGISSFEPVEGLGPRETDQFVLWAKKLLAAYKTRRSRARVN